MEQNIDKKIHDLNKEITQDSIKNFSNEELICYLFLKEKNTQEADKENEKIRKELASRNISKEELLKYYNEVLEATAKNIETIDKKIDEFKKIGENLFVDKNAENENDINLAQIIKEEITIGKDNKRLIKAYEKVRKNLLQQGVKNPVLENQITSENIDEFFKYLERYCNRNLHRNNKFRK